MRPVDGAVPVAPAGRLARMKDVAGRFEGVFVEQLFKAMRETVPQDGELSGGAGEDVFTSLFDEHIASEAPRQWHRGVSDAIVAHLTSAVPAVDPGTKVVDTPIRLHSLERDVP